VQAAAFAVPGLRRLMGVAPLGPLDLAVTVGAGVLPYFINEARRRRPSSKPKLLPAPA
jgi:P-type Ca2+ transporter type 2C